MTIQLSESKFGGCGCSLGREFCDCGFQCGQGRGPTREQLKPLGILNMTGREALFYAIGIVVAIAGFSIYPWSVA